MPNEKNMPAKSTVQSLAKTAEAKVGKKASKANIVVEKAVSKEETVHEEPKKSQVQDNLKSHLANRVAKETLVGNHILLADPTVGATGPILQAQQELKKKQIADKLGKKLVTRSSQEDLLEKNILKAPTTVSASLVAKQQDLKRSQIADTIEQQVKKSSETAGKGLNKRDSSAALETVAAPKSAKKTRK